MSFFSFFETPLRSPYWNLAIEEALALHLVRFDLKGGIRFWRNPSTIVLGLSEKPEETIQSNVLKDFQKVDQNYLLSKKPQLPLYISRRASGGGTVYQTASENLNFSLFLNLEKYPSFFGVKESYQSLLGVVCKALENIGIEASPQGKSDLAIESGSAWKKISGNAQFRKKNCLVQHGTLILSDNLIKTVTSILRHPPEEPSYRSGRNHRDFLTSLPASFPLDSFQKSLTSLWMEKLGVPGEDFDFLGTRFSSFRKRVYLESEKLRVQKYSGIPYILRREV